MGIFKSKEFVNARWLIGGRIAQMMLSFFVGILTTRYLGPANFGLISYITAITTLFSSVSNLGINSVLVKELIDDPANSGRILGSTMALRTISSFFSILMIVGLVYVFDESDKATILVAVLCSISLLIQTFEIFHYWFQSRYQSKVSAVTILISYALLSIYRIVILSLSKDVYWFAISSSIEYFFIAGFLYFAYRRNKGPKLTISIKTAKNLLSKGYHYIVAGAMISIYTQVDKFMIKQMLNVEQVGFYSLATSLATIWVFVLSAIIDSMYPTIVRTKKINNTEYERKNMLLYAIVFYVSIFVAIMFNIFGDFVVTTLYGDSYSESIPILKVLSWYIAFSYLGVARNVWVVSEGKQKYLKYIYVSAVVLNIILNYAFISIFNSTGAALATLVTQVFTSLLLPLLIKPLRSNTILMIKAILIRPILNTNCKNSV